MYKHIHILCTGHLYRGLPRFNESSFRSETFIILMNTFAKSCQFVTSHHASSICHFSSITDPSAKTMPPPKLKVKL